MRTLTASCILAVILASGCSEAGDDAKTQAAAPEAAATSTAAETPAAPATAAAGSWTKVRITGLTCGDNCYVQIQPVDGGEADDVMCSADLCTPWFENQALAAGVTGKTWEVQMGRAQQVDNEGAVMDDNFPAITAIREAT